MDRLRLFALLFVICGAVGRGTKALPSTDDNANADGVHWALIVAGSNGWYNYRHQADACHAYHVMRKHGIPAERIVLMMFDDIANNDENPTPGIVINHPDGDDVYGGVVIDYKGNDVTPKNFLAALSGNSEAVKGIGSGKVIKSGPHDHVFVNFADHGAPGLIAFPNDELYARDLMQTILSMHSDKKYGQMVLYIEACESGSMFDNLLPNNISVFATTAANPHESSYACYYDSKRNTYLGDVYSVNWMEDSDKEDLRAETLQKQFQIVKTETNTSNVMEYGDMAISKQPVADFQSDGSRRFRPDPVVLPKVPYDAVPSEHVPLSILYRRLMATDDVTEQHAIRDKISQLVELNQQVDEKMKSIVTFATRDDRQLTRVIGTRYRLSEYDCYEPAVELFDERCFDISQNDYALRQLYMLVNLCQEQVSVEKILESIAKVCTQ
jgi:legumain